MASVETAPVPGAGSTTIPLSWAEEARASFRLAWPLIVAQLAQNLLFTTDVVLMGWLVISRTGDNPSVSLNTDQIRVDTEKAADVTEELGEKASREGEKLVDEVKRTEIDVDVHREAE